MDFPFQVASEEAVVCPWAVGLVVVPAETFFVFSVSVARNLDEHNS